jgi:hypothetical protein
MRFGLLGTGPWAQNTHGPGLAAHPGAELVGVWGGPAGGAGGRGGGPGGPPPRPRGARGRPPRPGPRP